MLLLTLVVLMAGFAFTQYFVNVHRNVEQSLAQRWFTRGEQAMRAGQAAAAADDYRTALSYDRENRLYRLRLSQALLASNRLNEARSRLLSLWEEEPANGEVNLALARLHVRRGSPREAVRYYRNAINGVWGNDSREQRTASRFELVQYLMQQHDNGQAAAELLALQADEPPGIPERLRLADLLLQTGEAARSADVYKSVLKDDPNNAQAWLGLGNGSLALADYGGAEHALATAVQHDPNSAQARQQLQLVREVLQLAPSLRGLSLAERTRRVAKAFEIAMSRLVSCVSQHGYTLEPPATMKTSGASDHAAASPPAGKVAPSSGSETPAPDDLQRLYSSGLQKKAGASEAALRRNPDALESTMQYVFNVEQATAAACPSMEESDRALLVLARQESVNLR